MTQKLFYLLLLIAFGSLLISCNNDDINPGEKVEIYLLESFATIDNFCQIEENSVEIKSDPLLFYSDLLSYNSSTYIFELSSKTKEAIEALDFPTSGVPFAVTVDQEVIYTAYFWPGYSSATCQWLVTDPFSFNFNKGLKIMPGYPGQIDGIEIPDNRNDPRVLAVFRRDGKLRD